MDDMRKAMEDQTAVIAQMQKSMSDERARMNELEDRRTQASNQQSANLASLVEILRSSMSRTAQPSAAEAPSGLH